MEANLRAAKFDQLLFVILMLQEKLKAKVIQPLCTVISHSILSRLVHSHNLLYFRKFRDVNWVIIVVEKSASDWDTDTITNLNKNVSIRFSTSLAGEAPLKRSVPVAPSASATFGPRLPARSLLRGRLRNCLIHCVVIVISDRNCVGKHSNAFLVIQSFRDCFYFFESQIHFLFIFECIFKSEKYRSIPQYWLKLPDWSFQIEVSRLKFTDWSLQIEVWLKFDCYFWVAFALIHDCPVCLTTVRKYFWNIWKDGNINNINNVIKILFL